MEAFSLCKEIRKCDAQTKKTKQNKTVDDITLRHLFVYMVAAKVHLRIDQHQLSVFFQVLFFVFLKNIDLKVPTCVQGMTVP